MFLSSHILQDIEMICDRVAIIVEGSIINQGKLHELISEKILFTEIILTGIQEKELAGLGETITTYGGKTLIKILDERKVEEVLQLAQSKKASVLSLVPRTESLEDFFVSMVKSR